MKYVKAAAGFAAGVTLVATAVGVAASPAQAATPTYKLYVSTHPNRSAATPLAGRTLHGSVYIFALPASGALRVNFYLDDPKHKHAPIHSEGEPPYDFQGGDPTSPQAFKTSTLSNGRHNLTIVVDLSGHKQTSSSATFLVNNVPPKPKITGVTAGIRQITVTWKSGGGTTAGFYIYRSTHSHVPLSKPLNHLPLKKSRTSYVDKHVKSGVRYYYVVQAVGTSHGRTSSSAFRSGTVKTLTLIVTSVKASATAGRVNLLWAVRGTPQHIRIYRSTSKSVPLHNPIASPPPSKRSYVDTTVTNGTLYRYVIELVVGSHKTHSSGATATPVAVPANVKATGGPSGITVSWTSDTGASSYAIYRSTSTPVSMATPLHTASASTISWTDSAVTTGTTYYYVVQALSLHGHAEASATVTPVGAPVLKPTVSTDKRVALSWTAPTSGAIAVKNYRIFRGSSGPDALTHPALATTAANVLSYNDTSVTNDTAYFYVVQAVSNGGSANSVPQKGTPLASPALATITLNGSNKPVLTWNTDTKTPATSYRIYRGNSSSVAASGTPVGQVSSSTHTFTDASAADSKTYWYRVQAFYNGGHSESVAKSVTTATPPPPPPPAPAAVQDLAAVAGLGNGEVDLSWDMVDPLTTSLEIYRSTSMGSIGTKIDTVDPTTMDYVDTVDTTDTYYYTVRAVGVSGHNDTDPVSVDITVGP